MTGDARHLRIADELDRICAAGVERDAGIRVVDAMILIEDDILQHCAETEGLKDIGLALRGKVDRLRVAAALDVEDTIVAPAVLIIADEMSFGICRERGLSGAA